MIFLVGNCVLLLTIFDVDTSQLFDNLLTYILIPSQIDHNLAKSIDEHCLNPHPVPNPVPQAPKNPKLNPKIPQQNLIPLPKPFFLILFIDHGIR